MKLSEKQEVIFNKYKLNENIFITGPGGSGKSALIKYIVADAKEHNKEVQVCAMTGCAAVLLQCNAKTLHSWGGLGLAGGLNSVLASKIKNNRYKKKNWVNVDILIIDEVSMMSKKLFELINLTAQFCRKNLQYFGGIQVIFSGDFFQLPPIGSIHEPETTQYCFESPLWDKVFPNQIKLTEIFRQTDRNYIKILNQIRVGKLTKSTVTALTAIKNKTYDENSGIVPTKLYSTRYKVDLINTREMEKLETAEKTYKATGCDPSDLNLSTQQLELCSQLLLTHPELLKKEKDYMIENINFDKVVKLKVGAQVMCIANLDMESEKQICNGSRGIVTAFDLLNNPIVLFKNGITRTIGFHTWQSETVPCVGVKQIPLILAWAITIHKSQGASLDMAEIDIGSGIFECGQTYVALSRVTNMEGLYITSFDISKIIINKKVLDYYNRL